MKQILSTRTLLVMILAASIGCNGCAEKKELSDAQIRRTQKNLIKENKKQHEREIQKIDEFITSRKWPMKTTKTGMRYWVYEPSQGAIPQPEDIATVSYTISLLDGTVAYEATDNHPKQFRIERDNVETGLHEALQLMHVGERAKFIFPSHLAFGLTGDSGKIPPNASVLYDIHLISIQ